MTQGIQAHFQGLLSDLGQSTLFPVSKKDPSLFVSLGAYPVRKENKRCKCELRAAVFNYMY